MNVMVIQDWDVWRRRVSSFVFSSGHCWNRNKKGNNICIIFLEGANLVLSINDDAGNMWVRNDKDCSLWTVENAFPASNITVDMSGPGDVRAHIAEVEAWP